MSLILEALRKSEAERRRGNTPDVAMELPPTPLRARNAAPAWLWPVLLAVLIVIAFAGWLTGRRDAAAPVAPAIDTTVAASAPPAMAPAVVARTPDPAPAATTTATPSPGPASRDATTTATAPRTEAPPEPTRELPHPPILPPPVPAPAATSMSGVKLSMHMWDAAADKRFVILNGQRMGEGDRNDDVQVITIERDGVVVERDGQRARVPLP